MVEQIKSIPLIKIPADVQQRLKDMQADINRARSDIAALKKIGLDTHVIEDKLTWADEARKTLLEHFT